MRSRFWRKEPHKDHLRGTPSSGGFAAKNKEPLAGRHQRYCPIKKQPGGQGNVGNNCRSNKPHSTRVESRRFCLFVFCFLFFFKGRISKTLTKIFQEKKNEHWESAILRGHQTPSYICLCQLGFFPFLLCSLQNQLRKLQWQPTGKVMLRRAGTRWGSGEVAILSCFPVMVNFICQLGWTKGCPDS